MGAAKQPDFSVRLYVKKLEACQLTPNQGNSGRSWSFRNLAWPFTRKARNSRDSD